MCRSRPCTRAGDMIFVSGRAPFDPKIGELLVNAPSEQQAERILEELKTALEAAGFDLEHVMKINVFCVSPERFKAFNEIYKSATFPNNPPARIFFCVPVWTARLILKSSAHHGPERLAFRNSGSAQSGDCSKRRRSAPCDVPPLWRTLCGYCLGIDEVALRSCATTAESPWKCRKLQCND